MGVSMSKSNKLKCCYCGSNDLYLQQCIITKSDITEDEECRVIYEEPECFPDELVEEFTCYGCAGCGSNLTIDDEYGSAVVVNEQNLAEYRQKYCSGN
jgi:hypothetical protein